MTSTDFVSWSFDWLLAGTVIFALLMAGGLFDDAAARASRLGVVMASIAVIAAWPIIVAVFVGGIIGGGRKRRAR